MRRGQSMRIRADSLLHREGGVRRGYGLRSLRLSVSLRYLSKAANFLGQAGRPCSAYCKYGGVAITSYECGGLSGRCERSSMTTTTSFLPANLRHLTSLIPLYRGHRRSGLQAVSNVSSDGLRSSRVSMPFLWVPFSCIILSPKNCRDRASGGDVTFANIASGTTYFKAFQIVKYALNRLCMLYTLCYLFPCVSRKHGSIRSLTSLNS